MTYDPERHHRRSIRWRGADYTAKGAYFVTVCVQGRARLFGEVVEGEMRPNAAGLMVAEVWRSLPRRFPGVTVDAFVVMPDHFHGILFLAGDPADWTPAATSESMIVGAPLVGAQGGPSPTWPAAASAPNPVGRAPTRGAPTDAITRDPGGKRIAVGDVVGAFKSLTTLGYARGVKDLSWPRFAGALWQRNYYEHIIRDEEPLDQIREYVLDNPRRWAIARNGGAEAVP